MKRKPSGRFTRRSGYDRRAEIQTGASKPGGTIKPRPLTGSERYKAEDDLVSQLDRFARDGEAGK